MKNIALYCANAGKNGLTDDIQHDTNSHKRLRFFNGESKRYKIPFSDILWGGGANTGHSCLHMKDEEWFGYLVRVDYEFFLENLRKCV